MKRFAFGVLLAALLTAVCLPCLADDSIVVENLTPIQDTYATHDDDTVHGFEPIIKVGIEPQQCVPGGWNKCPDNDQECCVVDDGYNYCAPPGQCETTAPSWTSFRKYRGYLRFNLNSVPKGKILSATMRLTEVGKVQQMGGAFKMTITGLKKIGMGDNQICEWLEQSLNDTNGTTWNSLPQNISVTGEGVWAFDVTKAVTDWLQGNTDAPGNPIVPNCGFHLYDDDFGNQAEPILRLVEFSSKEGAFSPQLKVQVAQDIDGDGYFGDEDCNEDDPEIHPGAIELCDGVDQDCDGMEDDEGCDGIDNDCDGEIDEGTDMDLCGDGLTCSCSQCMPTCEDDCGSPSALKCELNADGTWERWACKKDADYDPCFDWYKYEDCEPGQLCNYGHCSGNCVDECDGEGDLGCWHDSKWDWFTAKCGDWDTDGCLEWGNLEPCGKGAICQEAQCWPNIAEKCEILSEGGCLSECLPETLDCAFADGMSQVMKCQKDDDTGCWKWSVQEVCNDPNKLLCKNKNSSSAKCTSEGNNDCFNTCSESLVGELNCFRNEVGTWFVAKCGDEDNDKCLEWDTLEICPPGSGCADGACTGGCDVKCDSLGSAMCEEQAAMCCYDKGGDGLLEWNELKVCQEGAEECEDGLCKPISIPCEDECDGAGLSKCEAEGSGTAYECVADADEDDCLEWGNPVPCDGGCNNDLTGCWTQVTPDGETDALIQAEPDQEVVTQADGVVAPDAADAAGDDHISQSDTLTGLDQAVAGDAAIADGPAIAADPGPGDGGGDDGCRMSHTGTPSAALLVLLLAGLALAMRCLRTRA